MATTAAVLHYTVMAKAASMLGNVRSFPCKSSADPAANDLTDDEAECLLGIEEAEGLLSQARDVIESRQPGSLLAADSMMVEAAGYLVEGNARDLLQVLRNIATQCDTDTSVLGIKVRGMARAALAKAGAL